MPVVARPDPLAPECRPFEVRPGSPAERLMYCRDIVIMGDGPTGSGKTRTALEKAYFCGRHWPNTRILLLRKVKAHAAASIMTTWSTQVVPHGDPAGVLRTQNYQSPTYDLGSGSYVAVDGMYDGSGYNEAVMGTEWDIIIMDEFNQFSENDLERAVGRLNRRKHAPSEIPFNQLIGTTNPDAKGHWAWKRHIAGLLTRIPSRLEDNPVYHDGVNWTPQGLLYKATLEQYTGVMLRRNRYGEWVGVEGMIYDEWDEEAHVIEKMPEGWEKWKKCRAIDLGYNDPFVCLWACVSPLRDIYVYREYVKTEETVQDHVAVMKQLQSPAENMEDAFEFTACDHDAEDRATLAQHGIENEPAIKTRTSVKDRTAWPAAFEPIKRRLRDRKVFILRTALQAGGGADVAMTAKGKLCGILDEIPSYQWAPSKPDQPTKECPAPGSHDHSCDAFRYLVHAVDSRPEFGLVSAKKEYPTAYQPDLGMTDEDADDSGWDLG